MKNKDFALLAKELRTVILVRIFESGKIVFRPTVSTEEVINSLCSFMKKQSPAFDPKEWREYLLNNCKEGLKK